MKTNIKNIFNYVKTFVKWLFIASVVGILGGVIGSFFHLSIDYVTELRMENSWILFLLPVGGIIITLIYYIT